MMRWLLALSVGLIFLGCGNDSLTKGGGTNVGDEAAMVTGIIKDKRGPAVGAVVLLHTSDFNPSQDTVAESNRTFTGSDGRYVFKVRVPGVYNIEASQPEHGTKVLLKGIKKSALKFIAADLETQIPGQIKIQLPDFLENSSGAIYIPGTSLVTHVKSDSVVTFYSVPPLDNMKIVFVDDKDHSMTTLVESIKVEAAEKVQISKFSLWAHQAEVKINTASASVSLDKNILNFPLLIRLNSENFAFDQANKDGSDLRFTKADGVTVLPYEIERWNAASSLAEIWVNVDTVFAARDSQSILMHYGNSNAKAMSNAKTVFDASTGYRGVWHLGENSTSSTVKDAVGNFNGVLKATDKGIFTSTVSKPNVIGTGFEFKDWKNEYWIDLGGNQNFVNGLTEISVSMWVNVKVDTSHRPDLFSLSVNGPVSSDPKSRIVVHFETGNLAILARAIDTTTNMEGFNLNPGVPLEQWFYITGVMNIGLNTMEVYVNGSRLDSIGTNHLQNMMSSGNSNHGAIAANDIGNGNYFSGSLDEVRLEAKARSPEWVKLCFENQRMGQVLVKVQGVK